MMHYENHILLVCTYWEIILFSHQDEIGNNTEVTITACQSKEPDQRLIRHTLHCSSSCFSHEKIVIHPIDRDVMILFIAYLSDIFQKNLNVLVYAKMVKSGVYHVYHVYIRTMILALDHSTFVALPFFMHFLAATQSLAFVLKKNVRNGMSGCKIVSTLMRYLFVLAIDQMM